MTNQYNTLLESIKDSKIFESPDGGKTIYERPFGGNLSERKLISNETRKSIFSDSDGIANDLIEDCVMCGNKTTTLKTTHIDFRTGYIEGAGQLCKECYMKGSSEGREHVMIPKYFIEQYPNNMELGAKVRTYYFENYL